MQRIGGRGIELGAEGDQARRLGGRQFEYPSKLRCSLEQARAMARLIVNFRSGRPLIAEFPEQKANIVDHTGLGRFTEQ